MDFPLPEPDLVCSKENELKKILFTLAFFAFSALSAQTLPDNGIDTKNSPDKTISDAKRKDWSFGYTLKFLSEQYFPAEFYRAKQRDSMDTDYSDLKDNRKNISALSFNYWLPDKNLKFEFSNQSILIGDAYYNESIIYTASQVYFDKVYLTPTQRRDTKLNAFFSFKESQFLQMEIGGGIRNIYKRRTAGRSSSVFEEEMQTFGPQLSFKAILNPSGDFRATLSADLFSTQGERSYKNDLLYSSGGNAYYQTYVTNPHTKGRFQGYEIDLSFGYRIWKNLVLNIGGNFINSWFDYDGFQDTVFTFSNSPTGPNAFPVYRGRYQETLKGFYLGLSAQF